MTGSSSSKWLLHAALFCAVMLAIPALAKEEKEKKENCAALGLETDRKGECCDANMMDETELGPTCFEKPSQMSVAVAFTLIGSWVFLISLQFATNYPDEDMQKYSYKVISSTVSIFTAVLMFQCLNGLIEDFIMDGFGIEGWMEFVVDFIHMLIWYSIMQVAICYSSFATKYEPYRIAILEHEEDERKNWFPKGPITKLSEAVFGPDPKAPGDMVTLEEVKDKVQVRAMCYGIVLAHLCGFASINAWTTMQQQAPFNSNPLMALIPMLCSGLTQVCLQRLMDRIREGIAFCDGEKDWFENKWDDICEEAEDDVLGLSLSVLLVNSLRMGLNGMVPAGDGCLPNQEQKEEGKECEEFIEEHLRTYGQVFWLFFIGICFAIALFVTKMVLEKVMGPEKEGEEEEGEGEGEEEEKSIGAQMIERLVETFCIVLMMSFSWCTFHANRELLVEISPKFLGKESNESVLAVVLALEVSVIAWIIIRILDKLADQDWTPPSVDDSIVKVIDAISLFVGFAWEQTFDSSVDSLAHDFRSETPYWGRHNPAFAKFIIGSSCCFVVFMAWKLYILPFVVKQGWQFGIVLSKDDIVSNATKLVKLEDLADLVGDILVEFANKEQTEKSEWAVRNLLPLFHHKYTSFLPTNKLTSENYQILDSILGPEGMGKQHSKAKRRKSVDKTLNADDDYRRLPAGPAPDAGRNGVPIDRLEAILQKLQAAEAEKTKLQALLETKLQVRF